MEQVTTEKKKTPKSAKSTEAPAPKKSTKVLPPELVLSLYAPGMTPLLRAGLGGLAASLRSILLAEKPDAVWPSPVSVAKGEAIIDAHKITLRWKESTPEEFFSALFASCFRIDKSGLIDLPGMYERKTPPTTELRSALQQALKRTFLQHGKTTDKKGAPSPITFSNGEQDITTNIQPYSWFIHQDVWETVISSLSGDSVSLAGWAYPGAAVKHTAFNSSSAFEYGVAEVLCASFSLIGCLSYMVGSGKSSALVIPEPSDLIKFAKKRSSMTPLTVAEVTVCGLGDAALKAQLALTVAELKNQDGIASVQAVEMQPMPWDQKQKYRAATLELESFDETTLELFDTAARSLPNRIRVIQPEKPKKGEKKPEKEPMEGGGFFVATSALRGFITNNLAQGRCWYEGFATAIVVTDKTRFIHYFKDKDNLGALYPEEKKGLIEMNNFLEDAERSLVRSVHIALGQRFGAIADETPGDTARKKRWSNERDKWRLAFSGSKTPEQIRAALADMWSRGGSNRELKENWEKVLPLLRPERWKAARDLALVALASYQGKEETQTTKPETQEEL